jgi:hypothetical protein
MGLPRRPLASGTTSVAPRRGQRLAVIPRFQNKVYQCFHTCAQDVQITHMANSIDKTAQMLQFQHIQSISHIK